MEEPVPDWSGLIFELLIEIANHVSSLEDFMAFRCVCSSWRAAGKFRSRQSIAAGAPLLMLTEKEESDDREFYSLSKKKIIMRLSLPEAKGKRCIEARFGWLLTLTKTGEFHLLNPFSRDQIKLPREGYDSCIYFARSAMLSANPSDSLNFILFVLASETLLCWRSGDSIWTRIKYSSHTPAIYDNMCYCNENLFIIDCVGRIMVWHSSDGGHIEEIVAVDKELLDKALYLVESSSCPGELRLITRQYDSVSQDMINLEHETRSFKVIRIDVVKREWEVIPDLSNEAVFVGWNYAISINPLPLSDDDDLIKPNCIYFTDAFSVQESDGKDMGYCKYGDPKNAKERFTVESLSHISPPVWIDSAIFFHNN